MSERCHLIYFINQLITINDVVGGSYYIIIIQLRVHTNGVRENVLISVRSRPFQRTGRENDEISASLGTISLLCLCHR